MSKVQFSALAARLLLSIAALAIVVGCDAQDTAPRQAEIVQPQPESANRAVPDTEEKPNTGIASDGIVSVENGKVKHGRPAVTEDVEKQIYKSLSHHRNVARSIEEQVPGKNRGSQQSREDYELAAKGYMLSFGISQGDIDAIMKKGDEKGWK